MPSNLLQQVPLFAHLNDEQLAAVAQVALHRTFAKEQYIILAGEEGDALFLVESGRVKVCLIDEAGREVILALLGPGAVFGELALLDEQPRSANVVALEETQTLLLRRVDFLPLVTRTPALAVALLRELAGRLRQTDQQVEGLAFQDVIQRLTDHLMQLAQEQGEERAEGWVLQPSLTHQELARMVGTTRETVSRMLKRLEEQGAIQRQGRTIILLKGALSASLRAGS